MLTTLLLCLVAVVADESRSAEYTAAYTKGREEADREVADGRATIYSYGLVRQSFDSETGLLLKPISGCIVDDAILGRARGHNARIREIFAGQDPPGSYKPWLKELRDLRGYFAGERAAGRIVPLDLDASPVRSPDGELTVGLREGAAKGDRGVPFLEIRASSGRGDRSLELLNLTKADVRSMELAWGPKGSNLVFVRWADAGPRMIPPMANVAAFDLKAGRFLSLEHERLPTPATGAR